jgi:hypothetical protein
MDTEVFRNAVLLACQAPSVDNTQPWRWVAAQDVVHRFLDHESRDMARGHIDNRGEPQRRGGSQTKS